MKVASRRSVLSGLGATVAALALPGCGYVIYQDRRGLPRGDRKVDPIVVLLDGLLCLVGIIPGVIAFAVDVSSSCLFLPAGASGEVTQLRRIQPRGLRRRDYEAALSEALALDLRLDDPRLRYVVEPMTLTAAGLAALAHDPGPTVAAAELAWDIGADGALEGIRRLG